MTNDEHDDLRDMVRAFLAKHRLVSREPGTYDAAVWGRLTDELGLTALSLNELPVEVAIVLEETGRSLLALPYLSTVVAGTLAPGLDGIGAVSLGGDVRSDGSRLDGTTDWVMDADIADVAVVAAGDALYSVSLAGVQRESASTLDHSRPVARLTFDRTPATRLDTSVDEAHDLLHLALAAEALGTAVASLESTVAHLRTRHQFGVALATFQALRHRVADLAVAVEGAVSTTWYAVRAPIEERPVVAPMAKLVAADAAYAVTAESIQLHGGIGFTWEHDAHRYFKRATVTRLTHGDPVALRRLIATRANLLP